MNLIRLLGWKRLALIAAIVAAISAPFLYSAIELARFERADARRATFVYASGQSLTPGVHVQRVGLAATLGRLGYTETRTTPPAPGHFRRSGGSWDIYLRGGDEAGGGQLLRLQIADERITKVTRAGQDVAGAALEPEVLASATDRPGEDHKPIRLDETPRVLIDAVLAAEDHRFFEHGGVDFRALLRAAWANLRAGRVKEGGSTITQQLVKVRLLNPRRTFFRKLREAWLAALVESRYSKERILEAYLNEIYLGQRGPIAIRGGRGDARLLRQRGSSADDARGGPDRGDHPRPEHLLAGRRPGSRARSSQHRPRPDARSEDDQA